MLPFGHMGIGSKLASPWSRDLSKPALLIGTILPDLIDKPLYYILSFATGKSGAALGIISSTRTLGHTAICLLLITGAAMIWRSRWLAALAMGVSTHLFLDNLGDTLSVYFDTHVSGERSALVALLWPFLKANYQFAIAPFANVQEHAQRSFNGVTIGAEIVGTAILGWDYWKNRHESEIMQLLLLRRRHKKRR